MKFQISLAPLLLDTLVKRILVQVVLNAFDVVLVLCCLLGCLHLPPCFNFYKIHLFLCDHRLVLFLFFLPLLVDLFDLCRHGIGLLCGLACLVGCGGVGGNCLGPKTFGVAIIVVGRVGPVGELSIGTE